MKDRDVLRAQMASRICATLVAQVASSKFSLLGDFMTKKSFMEMMKLIPRMSVDISDEIIEYVEKQ